MEAGGVARERDLRVLSAAIGLSALGDGVALVALALQAKNLSGEGMGGGLAIAAMFICLWSPVVLLSGHVGLLVDIGSEANIIEKSGAWYSYNGQRIGQGRENAKLFLKDNPVLQAEVEEKVKTVLGIRPLAVTPEQEPADE